ncbi:MAG: CcmD family protein [Chitinophagaceae bacterium]
MQKIRTLFFLLSLLLVSLFIQAQEGKGKSVVGETMRSSGRIYVVVAVMVTILAGLILYIVRLERKISKVEKDNLA